MTRLLIVALIAFVGSDAGPTPPQIVGPRRTADRTPTFRFVSHEAGPRARAIRFRCAIDRARLHRCPSRYTPSLRLGRHTVRARAVDPTGRVSRTSVAHVSVVRPVQHADQTIKVGAAPFNVAAGFGSVWVAIAGGLSRLDPASGRVVARINVGGRPWGVAVGEGAVWVGVAAGGGSVWAADNSTDAVWRLDPGTGAVLGVARVGDAHEFVGFGEGGGWVSSENGTVGVVGLVGVGVLAGVHPEGGWWGAVGTLAVVVASVSYAVGSLWGQRLIARTSGLVLSASSMLGGLLVLLPFGLLQLPGSVPGWKESGSVLALAVIGTAVSQIIAYRALRSDRPARVSLVTYLLPVTALFYGVTLLGEPLTWQELAGMALILSGVALGSGALRLPRPEPDTGPFAG